MRKLFLAFLFAAALTPACAAQDLKAAISSIGCKQLKPSAIKPMSISQQQYLRWLQDELKITRQKAYTAKCKAKDGLFYRTLFAEEQFADESDALKRFARIKEIPPGEHDKSDISVPIILGEGFQARNRIYRVGTFVYAAYLEGNVKIWKDKLQEKLIK